jgi:hypothetical protein
MPALRESDSRNQSSGQGSVRNGPERNDWNGAPTAPATFGHLVTRGALSAAGQSLHADAFAPHPRGKAGSRKCRRDSNRANDLGSSEWEFAGIQMMTLLPTASMNLSGNR